MRKQVVIAGDLIWDYNLVQHSKVIANHHEPLRETVLYQKSGGAWHLHSLVELACADIKSNKPDIRSAEQVEASARSNLYVIPAYTIWSLYPRTTGDKEQVWRISQFLGCQAPPAKSLPVVIDDDGTAPDVLVIDDIGLGFRNEDKLWPAALHDGRLKQTQIILKTVPPLAEGRLWKRLWDEYRDRVTIVLSVAALKARRAAISESLSWDRTIEETVREFECGLSSRDLAACRRVIVHFGEAGAASFTRCRRATNKAEFQQREDLLDGPARLERFLYHPEEMSGMWRASHPGKTFGATSIITAAVTRHELTPASFPLTIALKRALAAMRWNHRIGCGPAKSFETDAANKKIEQTLNGKGDCDELAAKIEQAVQDEEKSDKRVAKIKQIFQAQVDEPPPLYCTAFEHGLLSDPEMKKQLASRSDLLRDLTGAGLEYVAAKAIDVVLRGPAEALKFAPKARYGDYLTVDREEIERINALRSIIMSYRASLKEDKPLAIAVFGPPGSGKSFAIKQLAAELFGDKEASKATREFNLSQFESVHDLHTAFHQVRDASVQGQIPLVFWDEFDTGGLRWLKEFLAPIQDAKFQSGSLTFPFGKAIFVFAGGTCSDFASFDRSAAGGAEEKMFRDVKGPDFVSRLRGYVNIKGPNLVAPPTKSGAATSPDEAASQDAAYLIRRAMLLRSVLERYHGHLIDRQTKTAAISTSVIRGFLRVEKYLHGARSLEAVVKMSALAGATHFAVAELPSTELLKLHVTDDFIQKVQEAQLEAAVIETLARNCHEQWLKERKKGKGPQEKHPLMCAYDKLPDHGKEKNRIPARLTHAKLHQLGYCIVQRSAAGEAGKSKPKLTDQEIDRLMQIEHDIWLRDQLLQGYEYAPLRRGVRRDDLLLHRDATTFENVPADDQALDRAIAEGICEALWKSGYTIVKQPCTPDQPFPFLCLQ